jgi:hypothetical protein
MSTARLDRPDEHGRFGEFGGSFAPETLMPALANSTPPSVTPGPTRSSSTSTARAP